MWFALILTLFLASTLASPLGHHVVHEKRDSVPSAWKPVKRMEMYQIVPARIALKQSNIDKLEEYLMDVSDPLSANYGKHWSAHKVAKTFAPTTETIDTVMNWLQSAGVASERISSTSSKGWLQFNASIGELESLLQTEYYLYTHEMSNKLHVACTEYSVPIAVHDHLDFITPTVHFDAQLSGSSNADMIKRQSLTDCTGLIGSIGGVGCPGNGFLPKVGNALTFTPLAVQLSECDSYTVPSCLKALSNLTTPSGNQPTPNNSYGVVAYFPQEYNPGDVSLYLKNYGPPGLFGFGILSALLQPILVFINTVTAFTTGLVTAEYGVEGNLDVSVSMVLAYPEEVTFYEVAGSATDPTGATFNTLLEAFDGSYSADPAYDPTNVASGIVTAPLILSQSYGYNENDLTLAYAVRQCQEYGKLGMQGTTVLFASGDYGVAGNEGVCLNDTAGNPIRFNPSFPSTCPYVTSVGATQTVKDLSLGQGSTNSPEIACEAVIYSSGGFSNFFAMPDYQKAAVTAYLNGPVSPSVLGIGTNQYNSNGSARGYPDISANGANFVIFIDGIANLVFGTSASAPTFGSGLTHVNAQLLRSGRSPLGFINPMLYKNASGILNDITTGNNGAPGGICGTTTGCCGSNGFNATAGWDPVTGMGTPNFGNMLAAL